MKTTPNAIVIKRCPSWSLVSGLLGEWGRFEHHGTHLSPARAAEIAAYLYAAWHCKRRGLKMPKDWTRCHPSMPAQVGAIADRICAHPLIAGMNDQPTYWIECG